MKKRILSMMLVTAMVIAALSSCGQNDDTPAADNTETASEPETSVSTESPETESKDLAYKVGVSNLADSDENCYIACSTFKTIVESEGFSDAVGHEVTVDWTDSNDDITKQTSNVETLIAKGIDMLFMLGVDTAGNSSAVEACNKAGVPVFMVASESDGGEYRFVGFNEYDCGKVQGEYVAENAAEGDKICYMEGTPGREAQVLREEGFMDGISGRDDLEILSTQSGNFSAEEAMQVTEDWLQAYGDDIDWIVTQDNQMVQGVVEVLKAANAIDKVRISGWIVPGTWDAEYVKNGDTEQAVYVSFATLGETMAEVCQKYYNGEEIEDQTYMDLFSVTDDNFSEFFE